MLIPTITYDNFFRNPNLVLDYAKTLEYKESPKGIYPGARTEPLHEINTNLFLEVTGKILKLLWPTSHLKINFNARSYFQKIPKNFKNEGWVHQDQGLISSIIYLSPHKNCGTSIFQPLNTNYWKNTQLKKDIYVNKTFDNEEKYVKENNSNFEETIHVKSRYNRVIIFDGQSYHAAQKFCEEGVEEDRLILVTFFMGIHGPGLSWHGPECNRT